MVEEMNSISAVKWLLPECYFVCVKISFDRYAGHTKSFRKYGAANKDARLRRNLSTELVAERAGISRATLWAVEKGTPTVAIGTYAAVLV